MNELCFYNISKAKIRLEVCAEIVQYSEGPLSIMVQPECADVWDATLCYTDRYGCPEAQIILIIV